MVIYIENLGAATKSLFTDLGDIRLSMSRFSLLSDVSSDLVDLTSVVTGFKAILGNNSGSYPDLWTAVSDINLSLQELQKVTSILDSHHNLSKNLQDVKITLKTFGDHWEALGSNWLPLISKHNHVIENFHPMSTPDTTDALLQRGVSPPTSTTISSSSNNEMILRLNAVEARVVELEDALENR